MKKIFTLILALILLVTFSSTNTQAQTELGGDNQPTFISSSINGQPALSFNGSSSHFKVTKSSITEYRSGNLSSDFTISNGFISMFDTQKIAMILIEKLKSANTELKINRLDLELNGIPVQ